MFENTQIQHTAHQLHSISVVEFDKVNL